ncbi:unnamed protein product [Pleuronectes platessa]|uniref:Uncharacterized protein n=1 Tax=Pleuronectes platessa TaxID=8262 RepID=A0A9N7UFA7_PLEPL|nr:unnamed protein product [Pleuronectes platessa]
MAAASKRRRWSGRKLLATEDEITARPTRDFLPRQEVEAQLRGKGLFLCHPRCSCPCSSRVLLHDPDEMCSGSRDAIISTSSRSAHELIRWHMIPIVRTVKSLHGPGRFSQFAGEPAPAPAWLHRAAQTVEGLSGCHKAWWPRDLLVEVSEYKRRQL